MHWRKNLQHSCESLAAPCDSTSGALCPLVTPWCDTSQQSAQLWNLHWMSNHFSLLREYNHISSARYQGMPTRRLVRQALLAEPTAKRLDVILGQGGVTASPTLLGPVLVCSQQNYLKLIWCEIDREILQVVLWMLPQQPSLEENWAWKWMKWITLLLVY